MKNTCYSITIGEHNQKKILENKKNVHKQPLEMFYKKLFLKICNTHSNKPELESLFKEVLPPQVFPLNIAKFLRTPI